MIGEKPSNKIADAVTMIRAAAGSCVALTGAGISVASGIPAFRGSQGLWDKYDPFLYAEIGNFRRQPEKSWEMLAEMLRVVERAVPNPAHRALAELEEMGLLRAIITQNVDSLHQAAGSRRVMEFHGANRRLICLECGFEDRLQPLNEYDRLPPRCPECNTVLKPDVVFFGEAIPPAVLTESTQEAEKARLMLVIGTSANVYPAAEMPLLTLHSGGRVLEINLEKTPLTHKVAELTIFAPADEVLPEILRQLQNG